MSIYSSLLPEAHLNHNVFDTSARDVFSLKNGALTPFYFKGTVPDSVYDLQVLDKIELNGMPRANFGRMTQQIDFFFVPYSQLWKPFDNAYYQRLDKVRNPTNTLNPLLPDAVPTFNLNELVNDLAFSYVVSRLVDDVVSLLGRGAQYSDQTLHTIGEAFDYEILQQRSSTYLQDVHGRLCIDDILRNLDLMGYGNFLPIFKLIYKGIVIMYVDSTFTPQNMIWDEEFINNKFANIESTYQSMILATQFGSSSPNTSLHGWPDEVLGSFALDTDIPWELLWSETDYHPNAWPILAYLKIYNDYYKSFQYDSQNYAYYYNYDWLSNPSVNNEIPTDRIIECLKPRYHLYKRDMFTGGYPNSQFGNVAVVFTDTDFHKLVGNVHSSSSVYLNAGDVFTQNTSNVAMQSQGGSPTTIAERFKFDPALSVSVLAMRQAEAMQKWKEKNLRAGDRLKNQQTAFFGDRSRYIEDDYCMDIGSTYTPIMIDDVTATSDGVGTDSIKVGEKGSAGSSSHSNNVVHNFQCHDFGVIVGIMYILPESEYEAFGFDPMNIKVKPTDYFMVDFQNLGLAPVPSLLFDHSGSGQRIINYLSRYYEYKTRISKVHGEFTSDGAFGDYVTPRNSKDLKELTLSGLQVAPFDIDNLFYQASNMYQSSDQFKVNMNVISKDILPMSVTGLPY